MDTRWTAAFALADLPVGASRVFKQGGKQVAVFRLEADTLYAVDNRCPHEGYPLAQGYVRDCVLTCAWHNFKFDLRDGACLVGEEAVRTYPLRLVEGTVEIDLADPDPAAQYPKLLASLEEGLLERSLGRVARDVARLLQAGYPPEQIVLAAARFDADRAEYGTTHALPVAADALRYLERYPGLEATLPIMQAMDVASEASIRRPRREVPEAIDPGEDPVAAGERLRALVEAESGAEAEGLLRGALAKGWGRAELEPWFYALCADHFLDFGHPLIYTVKVCDLIDRVGWAHAGELLPALVFSIVSGTREDTLPAWAPFRRRFAEVAPLLPGIWAQPRSTASRGIVEGLLLALLEGESDAVFSGLMGALEEGRGLLDLVDTLSLAASIRLLRFHGEIDRDRGVQEGWLDVTHLLTYTNAVRHAVQRWQDPRVLTFLFHAARFIHNARPLDLPAELSGRIDPHYPRSSDLDEARDGVLEAIRDRDPEAATARAAGWLAAGLPLEPLWTLLEDHALQDPATRPIFVAHVIKTTFAAREELEALGERLVASLPAHAELPDVAPSVPDYGIPLLALVNFVASPMQERSVGRLTFEAIQFVAHGRTPKTLTG